MKQIANIPNHAAGGRITVALTGPTGEIGISAVTALEQKSLLERTPKYTAAQTLKSLASTE